VKARSIIAGVVLIVALLAVGAGIAWWKMRPQNGGQQAMSGPPPEFVDIVSAKAESWQPTGRLVGTVVARRSITLANEVVGVVTDVGFDSGDTVEAGQVLIKIDSATEQADLTAAEATQRLAAAAIEVAQSDIKAAETGVQWAKNNYERYKSAPAESVSASDVDKARTDLDKATAALEHEHSMVTQKKAEADQAAAKADQIRTTIAKKTLRSPFRARAGMRSIHPGQYLAEGTSIVSLTELTDSIYLDFAIPQEYTALVHPGTTVSAKSTILGRGEAKSVQIAVLSMDATVNPLTRNVRVRTEVPNPGYLLKPGMSIDVEVPIGPPAPSVTIPTTAVRRAAFGDHVFVLEPAPPPPAGAAPSAPDAPQMPPAQIAKLRMVTVGTNLGDRVIISSGLKEGEQIAAAGSFKLHDGAVVFPAPPKAPAQSSEKPAATTSSR
jgi:membrane fusion protein (multidrug efflux system)